MVNGKEIEPRIEISQPAIHLADGTEVPARLALEDPDTGLACVVPEKPLKKPLAGVPIQDRPQPGQFDQVVGIARHSVTFRREPHARRGAFGTGTPVPVPGAGRATVLVRRSRAGGSADGGDDAAAATPGLAG